MILFVLFVMLAGTAFYIYAAWWLLTTLPPRACLAARGIAKVIGDGAHRTRWWLLHAWNVICLRRWVVAGVASGVLLLTLIYNLASCPIYSATCIISVQRVVDDIT